jgi:hypothetical protein
MIPVRLLLIVLVLGLAFAGALGLYQSVPVVWNATWQRITNKTPLEQADAFNEDGLYASIIEAKSEIRPGDDLTIVIRGKGYQKIEKDSKITYKIQAKNTAFVKSITPTQSTVEIKAQADYILPPINIVAATNQLANSPSQAQFGIIQEIEVDGEPKIVSDPVLLSVAIDNSAFPTGDVVKAFLSLVGFLLGIFGTKISIGI